MNRRDTIIRMLALGCVPTFSLAQQSPNVARIGFLGLTSASAPVSVKRVEALRTGLRELGYVEGKNITIDFRWADDKYERLLGLATELVQLKVDVIVTYSTPGTIAAKQATRTIPIVMATSGDAVTTGIVTNLARPEGNVTGTTFFNTELAAKRLEILKDGLPRIKRVGVLINPENASHREILPAMALAAKSLKLELLRFEARKSEEIVSVFPAMTASGVNAVVIIEDPVFTGNARRLAELAIKSRLPSIGFPEFGDAGGLIGYGVNLLVLFHHAAYFVDKILKGVKPVELPVERPTTFDLIINMKTARALGITFPITLLVRADRVIE